MTYTTDQAIALAQEVGAFMEVLFAGRHDNVVLTESELTALCNKVKRDTLLEVQRENRELEDEVLHLQLRLNDAADTFLVMKVELEEAKKDAALWKALCKQLWVACPTTLECRAFHHAKQDQHRMTETCRPQEEYLAAIDAVNQAMREGE